MIERKRNLEGEIRRHKALNIVGQSCLWDVKGVGVKPEFIKKETIKRSVYPGEIHILMKQTSTEINKWINWGLDIVINVDDSWTTTSDSNLNS